MQQLNVETNNDARRIRVIQSIAAEPLLQSIRMDIVFIKGLKCQTILGVYAWERVALRPVVIDLDIGADQEAAFVHDNAVGLMNYDSISRRLAELLPTLSYKTVERLATHVADVVLNEFHAPYVKVTIGKPGAVAGAAMVGVTIERRAT
jgi:7,8-dihydroneopterin aldolase/epimerase/oxygenase